MRDYSNRLVENNRECVPPARLVRELFEQQRSDTDALRTRIGKLEKAFRQFCSAWPATRIQMIHSKSLTGFFRKN